MKQLLITARNKAFNYAGFSNLPDAQKAQPRGCFFKPVNSNVKCIWVVLQWKLQSSIKRLPILGRLGY